MTVVISVIITLVFRKIALIRLEDTDNELTTLSQLRSYFVEEDFEANISVRIRTIGVEFFKLFF